jgi:hypothetical protein
MLQLILEGSSDLFSMSLDAVLRKFSAFEERVDAFSTMELDEGKGRFVSG